MDEQKLKINPTLITDVTPGDPIMEDEIFGPVLPFVPVDTVDEAINLVNSKYVKYEWCAPKMERICP